MIIQEWKYKGNVIAMHYVDGELEDPINTTIKPEEFEGIYFFRLTPWPNAGPLIAESKDSIMYFQARNI